MNTQEHADAAVQSSRDQGIADACAGRRAKFWLSAVNAIWALEIDGWRMITEDDPEYRAAFAYARAYEAEKGAE
jgi:hypothetical protein